MSFVSLHLSIVTMFPLPNFQFFTTLFLSHSHINYLFKLYNVISTGVHLDTITPSSTTTKNSSILIVLHIFQSSFSFYHFEKTSIVLLEIFKVKSTIGWPFRWTKCTNRNDLFFPFLFGILAFSLWSDFATFLPKFFNDIGFCYP